MRAELYRTTSPACPHPPRVLAYRAWLAGCLLLATAAPLTAAQVEDATNSRRAREDALRQIPVAKLAPEHRQRVLGVLNGATVFRRLPTQVIHCDPAMYLFLLEHPEVVVNTWKVMEITDIALERAGPATFRVDDGAGTRGTVEIVHRDQDCHVILCDGAYEGTLFQRRLSGRAVVVLRSSYTRESDGKQNVTCRLDAFVQLDNIGVEVFAKTFQPLVGSVADHNFRETANFFQTVNATAESNHKGMRRLANKLDQVHPQVRDRFARISEEVAIRAAVAAETQTADSSPMPRRVTPAPTERRPTFRR